MQFSCVVQIYTFCPDRLSRFLLNDSVLLIFFSVWWHFENRPNIKPKNAIYYSSVDYIMDFKIPCISEKNLVLRNKHRITEFWIPCKTEDWFFTRDSYLLGFNWIVKCNFNGLFSFWKFNYKVIKRWKNPIFHRVNSYN